jgi:hypothetical protein
MGLLDQIRSVGEVRVTRTLDLGDLDEAWRGAAFEVWVMPTRGVLREFDECNARLQRENATLGMRIRQAEGTDELAEAMAELDALREWWEGFRVRWYARIWGMEEGEAEQIWEALPETAWDWVCGRSSSMIGAYRGEVLKNSRDGSSGS